MWVIIPCLSEEGERVGLRLVVAMARYQTQPSHKNHRRPSRVRSRVMPRGQAVMSTWLGPFFLAYEYHYGGCCSWIRRLKRKQIIVSGWRLWGCSNNVVPMRLLGILHVSQELKPRGKGLAAWRGSWAILVAGRNRFSLQDSKSLVFRGPDPSVDQSDMFRKMHLGSNPGIRCTACHPDYSTKSMWGTGLKTALRCPLSLPAHSRSCIMHQCFRQLSSDPSPASSLRMTYGHDSQSFHRLASSIPSANVPTLASIA